MKLVEWTLFCSENPHLIKGIMYCNPPGGMSKYAVEYVKLASREHLIIALAQFQIQEAEPATLDHVFIKYGPKSEEVYPRFSGIPIIWPALEEWRRTLPNRVGEKVVCIGPYSPA